LSTRQLEHEQLKGLKQQEQILALNVKSNQETLAHQQQELRDKESELDNCTREFQQVFADF